MNILPTTTKFDEIYRSLLAADVRRQLSPFFPAQIIPEEQDLAYALSVATRLSLSGNGDTEANAAAGRRAYDVAVRSLNFANGSSAAVRAVCDLILSRIGNFPARALLQEQMGSDRLLSDPFLQMEMLVRESENKIRGTASETVLTDFQVRLIRALEASRSVSVSAPTSAGKSFTLEIELLRRLKDDESYVALFLVPTRALIRQVIFDLVQLLRRHDLNAVPVLSAPTTPVSPRDGGKMIYVLTQERLATLLTSDNSEFRLDAIVVDEAHEIEESSRGQTLERAIGMTLRRFPTARLFFSSPLRSNPELLLHIFGREGGGQHFVEHLSPVAQNIINVLPVTRNTRSARLQMVVDEMVVDLGTVHLPFPFRGSYLGKFAVNFSGSEDTSIVYCNEPATADKVALEIAEVIPEDSSDPDLVEFASFLRQEVHPRYRLAQLVQTGVGFHYGNMPQIIRGRLEELLRDRKLRFVCCTSTLLQGMNLPAKNIFVEDPKKGRGVVMKKGDFWNLVGRAGRLSKEFCGNVFCIFGKDWETDATSDRLTTIESAFEVCLRQRTPELLKVVTDPPHSSESKELSWAEQTYARVYAEFLASGKRLADVADERTREQFQQIDSFSAGFRRTLPDTIFVNNFYVHPARLESLASVLRSKTDILAWVPVYPWVRNSYDRLLAIFELIEELMIRSETKAYTYYAFLANQWMKGESIRELVRNKIGWSRAHTDAEINNAIRELFRDLEDGLRYRYVKYTRIYGEVLHSVLVERGLRQEADTLLPLHLFLEYGAASETLINLMAIGLSRTSAIFFNSFLSLRRNLTSPECQEYINSVNLDRSSLPAICKAEISKLRRIRG